LRQQNAGTAQFLTFRELLRVPFSSRMSTKPPEELDWGAIQADWDRFKAQAKRRWDRIGEQQLHALGGRRALLAARIKEAYGLSNEDTEKKLTDWQLGLERR
jgi:hypothetical protein